MPDAESPLAVADWVELELAAGEPYLSKARIASIVQSETGSEAGEALLSDVWHQLEERQSRYTKQFFFREGDLVRRSPDYADSSEYVACLLFSLYGVSDEHRTDPKIFERLAAVAIKNYLQGKAFVFGWPVLPDVQADIALRVKDVAAAAREKHVEAPAARYKDRGVDVIAWKPFVEHPTGEHRSNQIVILAQCAAGANWRQKTGQLPHKSWTQYFHWACDPLQGFAVPCVIPPELWHDISRESGGILFDRIRIVNLLPDGVQDEELSVEIGTWVAQELQESRA
ncbi:MAG: hypothetical protein ACHQLQ_02530 [Candidatus Acidiferrales bacterium]